MSEPEAVDLPRRSAFGVLLTGSSGGLKKATWTRWNMGSSGEASTVRKLNPASASASASAATVPSGSAPSR
jgi:hypothetical protein